MQVYRDINGDSGVSGYDVSESSILIQFSSGSTYLYTDASAGAQHIANMKDLAARGDGLNAYISKHVRKLYARKEL